MTTGKRHTPKCECSCDCSAPPPACSLTGMVSGDNVILSWSYSGTKVNRVSIYKSTTSSNSEPCKLDAPVQIYSTSDTNVRNYTVPNGLCSKYTLAVCNPCGCCYSCWDDGRYGQCQCFTCTYMSGGNTLTRRYTGYPNIQCGCQRGKVFSMSCTLSGILSLYTSDVDKRVHNPNGGNVSATGGSCICECTGAPGIDGTPLPDGVVFRDYSWEKVTGADCVNGTYIFNVQNSNSSIINGPGCGTVVNPSYYHLGTVTAIRQSAATSATTWVPCAGITKTSHSCDNRYISGPFTSTYELFLIGAASLLHGTNSQFDGNGNPVTIDYLGGGATGPALDSPLDTFPKILAIRTSTNDSSVAANEPASAFLFDTGSELSHKMYDVPASTAYWTSSDLYAAWVYPNPRDGCGWVKQPKTLVFDTMRFMDSADCAIIAQYTFPPSGPVRYDNCDAYGYCTEITHSLGRLMMYAYGETVFTTEFS